MTVIHLPQYEEGDLTERQSTRPSDHRQRGVGEG